MNRDNPNWSSPHYPGILSSHRIETIHFVKLVASLIPIVLIAINIIIPATAHSFSELLVQPVLSNSFNADEFKPYSAYQPYRTLTSVIRSLETNLREVQRTQFSEKLSADFLGSPSIVALIFLSSFTFFCFEFGTLRKLLQKRRTSGQRTDGSRPETLASTDSTMTAKIPGDSDARMTNP